tara:strand:+ start:2308 stop:2505 length:198 start_codon:yes stop_codon:yes gene_type:complete
MKKFRIDRNTGSVYVYQNHTKAYCYLSSFASIGARYEHADKTIEKKAKHYYENSTGGDETAHYDY